jgi:membrane associated rhomboid family serine protease
VLVAPVEPGQTQALARLDGRLVALALWDRLPYWLKAAWQTALTGIPAERVRAYLEREAAPVALSAASTSSVLPETLRHSARARLEALALDQRTAAALDRHFDRLVATNKNALLRHIGSPVRVDPTRDRVDLLAEIVALRQAQDDVRAERALSRAFSALFVAREPFAVWCIVALCFAVHLAFGLAGPRESAPWQAVLRLEAGIERPRTLVSYAFVHLGDLRHVLLNMLSLASLGPVLERILGPGRFTLFFVGAAAVGGLASIVARLALGHSFATVGASAAVAGLAGLSVTLGLWFVRRHGRIPLRYTAGTLGGGLVLVSNMLIGVASGGGGVDHAAHLGGLLFGIGVALVWATTLTERVSARYHVLTR